MHVEHCILTQAPPDVIFRTWQDVAHWPTWDPETRQARPDGPLLPGAPGHLTPTQGRTVPMMVTEVVAGRHARADAHPAVEHRLAGHAGQAAGTGGVPCNAPLTGPPAFSAPAPATAGGRRTG